MTRHTVIDTISDCTPRFWEHPLRHGHWWYAFIHHVVNRTLIRATGTHLIMLALGSAIASSYALHYQRRPQESFEKNSGSNIWQRFGNGNSVVERWQALGASGVVMGMGASATLLAPFAQMSVMFIPMPLFILTAGYVAFDTYYLDSKTSRIGHAAHLGGLTFGVVYYLASLRQFGGVWQFLRRGLLRR